MTFFESHLSCQGKKYYTFHYNKKVELLRNSTNVVYNTEFASSELLYFIYHKKRKKLK
ncbi:MAG: hypothetical protein HZB65_04790 [Candidatus Aenigmarchaeota archaeon]|nr:hypothetical protein [Candidatus Aenigmarchaeota archaeon]